MSFSIFSTCLPEPRACAKRRSSAALSNVTRPISRRYIRTGSSMNSEPSMPLAASSSAAAAWSFASARSSLPGTVAVAPFDPFAVRTASAIAAAAVLLAASFSSTTSGSSTALSPAIFVSARAGRLRVCSAKSHLFLFVGWLLGLRGRAAAEKDREKPGGDADDEGRYLRRFALRPQHLLAAERLLDLHVA